MAVAKHVQKPLFYTITLCLERKQIRTQSHGCYSEQLLVGAVDRTAVRAKGGEHTTGATH